MNRGIVFAVVGTLLAIAGCGSAADSAPVVAAPEPIRHDVPLLTPESTRGQIVSRRSLQVTSRLRAAAALSVAAVYRSTSGRDGRATEVSGAFFVPRGRPPAGGWPVIAAAHGTLGLAHGCGPSSSADLAGYADSVAGMLELGYAVAVPDGEGLGATGSHPYLEPRTAAFNVIDAVRTLRRLATTVSSRWLAYGESQGGQAAWSAAERAGDYGRGLTLVGAVAVAPAANIAGLPELVARGGLTRGQREVLPTIVAGAARIAPEAALTSAVAAVPAADLAAVTGCDAAVRADAAGRASVRPLVDLDAATAGELTGVLRRSALPQRPAAAPLLVVTGDADDVVPPEWTARAVRDACGLGDVVEHRVVEGGGHSGLDIGGSGRDWVVDRFAGRPAPSTCGEAGT